MPMLTLTVRHRLIWRQCSLSHSTPRLNSLNLDQLRVCCIMLDRVATVCPFARPTSGSWLDSDPQSRTKSSTTSRSFCCVQARCPCRGGGVSCDNCHVILDSGDNSNAIDSGVAENATVESQDGFGPLL